MNEDLKKIKNKFGERMSRLCRSLFPTLLEMFPSELPKLLSDHFEPNSSLYDDIINNNLEENFKNYIYSFVDVENKKVISDKTPKELLKEAGYNLYECKDEGDIQKFKKYYKTGEELCTFHGGRLNSCYVFFAVKDNVEEIKRENFPNPSRQDEYGTSVISIQFTRDDLHVLSIKNRYNHKVNNPDATFSNNLDNIIPGLTYSFEKTYGLNQIIKSSFEMPGYVLANDGKYYKYNYEIYNKYYCPNNVIIDNFEVKKYDTSRYLIIDYFILDMKKKEEGESWIRTYDDTISDSFLESIGKIEKISITKQKDKKIITIKPLNMENASSENIIIELNKNNQIIGYINNNVEEIGNDFLLFNGTLENIGLDNTRRIGMKFLDKNKKIKALNFPNLEIIEWSFLSLNQILESISIPKVKAIGGFFLSENKCLKTIDLPNAEYIGGHFLSHNCILENINIPKVRSIMGSFLFSNQTLKRIDAPCVVEIDREFMYQNDSVILVNMPNLEKVGDGFFAKNTTLERLNLPKLVIVGNSFLISNYVIYDIYAPNLQKCGNNCLRINSKVFLEKLIENNEKNGEYYEEIDNKKYK